MPRTKTKAAPKKASKGGRGGAKKAAASKSA